MTDELTERVARAIEEATCGRIFDGYIAARAAIEAYEAGKHLIPDLREECANLDYLNQSYLEEIAGLRAAIEAYEAAPQPAPALKQLESPK